MVEHVPETKFPANESIDAAFRSRFSSLTCIPRETSQLLNRGVPFLGSFLTQSEFSIVQFLPLVLLCLESKRDGIKYFIRIK